MIKRTKKITSLLVAAAATISLVPSGVSAGEVKKIESKEGTIYNAASFSNGAYYIDGEVNDNSSSAVYYVSPDGKYNELKDISSGSDAFNFAAKYAYVDNGDYAVDMTNGTVIDDDMREVILDNAGEALKKNIKKDTDDRYDDPKALKTYEAKQILRKPGNYFFTTYTGNTIKTKGGSTINGVPGQFSICFDINGNYIDADYNLGKIKVTTTAAGVDGKTIISQATIENTEDDYNITSGGKVNASISDLSFGNIIGHDLTNVYRFARITVTASDVNAEITKINGKSVEDASDVFTYVNGDKNKVSFQVIQKISKEAAADNVGGAKYAKTVTNYIVSNKDGEAIKGIDGTGVLTGKGYSYYLQDGKISVYSVDANKEKVSIRTYMLKANNGYNYIDEGDESTEDCEVAEDHSGTKVGQVKSSGGFLFRLDGGYVYTYNNDGDWDKLYKVDGALNEFTVENKDNMILWNQDESLYSVISTVPKATATTAPAVIEIAKNKGWVNTAAGWTFYDDAGNQVFGKWIKNNDAWYMIKADGIMVTGWYNDNGTWYYLNTNGAMVANTTVDGYVLGANGAWIN
ncbi:N-acetylmuramoyl-L-alanine amidase family protein [Clostridium saccharoperbutylacetonicum]